MPRLLFFDFYPLLAKGAASLIRERIGGLELVEAHTFTEIGRLLETVPPIDLAIVGVGGENDFKILELISSEGIPMILFYHDPEKVLHLKNTFIHVKGLISRSLDAKSFVLFVKQVLEKGKGICPVTQLYFFDYLQQVRSPVAKRGETPVEKGRGMESLTKREREIFLLLKEGKNQRAISRKLAIRPSTVSTLKRKLYTKLEVENIIQLVKKY